MTTSMIVNTHNWEVKVTDLNPHGGPAGEVTIIPKNSSRTFHIHSNKDLLIHEIQPNIEVRDLTLEKSESRKIDVGLSSPEKVKHITLDRQK